MQNDFKYQAFDRAIAATYAAHGKSYPSSAVMAAIWDRVRKLPEAFLTWACKELADYEKLPGNIGREFERVLWPNYKTTNADNFVAKEQKSCPDCQNEAGGMGFYAFMPEPRWTNSPWHIVFCPCRCNNDHEALKAHVTSKPQMRALGWSTCPVGGYPGGHLAYIRDKLQSQQTAICQNLSRNAA